MGRRGVLAGNPGEVTRLDDQELAQQLHGARIRLGMGGNATIRSGWRKRIIMLEREVARREGARAG